jgi:undecaprenyl diphosphate synthase
VLTLFAFSSENWQRPKAEVSTLMELFLSTLRREAQDLAEHGIRLRFIGDRGAFPAKLQRQIALAEDITSRRCDMVLNVAANYGGRWDVTQAMRRLVRELPQHERLTEEQITSEAIGARLATAGMPEPDLFIRTGGERRISNFLLWQMAYTELYFTEVLWPDFDEAALDCALASYASRQRRYGKTGEQIVAVGGG